MIDIQITDSTLSVTKCEELVFDDRAGGTVVFIGTVRNHTKKKKVIRLEFESFVSMAENELKKIAQSVTKRWGVLHVAIHHRVGVLDIGEIPVIIAVSTPHREAAFEACKHIIDRLKENVPIWKKEVFDDGETWVSAHP